MSGLKAVFNISQASAGQYVIADYTASNASISGAAFASISGIPAGRSYVMHYAGTTQHPRCVVLELKTTTWYVNGTTGQDQNTGITAQQAFATIQRAADLVQVGDTVVIAPGIYSEHVQIRARGTATHPITFKADLIRPGRVIVTGADPDVRDKSVTWTLEDTTLNLYSIPWSKPRPTRVLYNNADLYPYKGLDALKQFMSTTTIVGPRHGFALASDPASGQPRLYVRLHASGNYGSTNPNNNTMCISPTNLSGSYLDVSVPEDYNIGILGLGNAHVIVQGITCETPGKAGVYTQANDVTVRDCWFYGCFAGVSGTAPYAASSSPYSYDFTANRVTVENCYFTQFPTYEDGLETIALGNTFWQRKDEAGGLPIFSMNYEIGLALLIGEDWVIRKNHITNCFEGLSARATTHSKNLQVYENLFDKLLDNAIETENYSKDMYIHHNVCVDIPWVFSWQPIGVTARPGPIYIYKNVIYDRAPHVAAFGFRSTSVFKLLGDDDILPLTVPAPGWITYNNTIFRQGTNSLLFSCNRWGQYGFSFYNNIFITSWGFYNYAPGNKWQGDEYVFGANFTAPSSASTAGAPACIGSGGQHFPNFTQIGLSNPAAAGFAPVAGSPVINHSVTVPNAPEPLGEYNDLGAIQQGETWYPLVGTGPRQN